MVATVALLLVLLWLLLTVHYNDHDNWTALYYTGAQSTVPPQLGDEDVFQVRGSTGYDGQYYHYIAHDPFFQRGMEKYVDNPHLRYRRIFVPALAYLLAFGNEEYVDSLYLAITLAFLWAGAYWLSRFAAVHGISPWAGLAFVLIPSVLVTLDRLTVDLALAALAIGFIYYADRGHWRTLCLILTIAPLVRETGVIFIAAICIWKWRKAWLFALCALPFLAWELLLRLRWGSDQTVYTTSIPYSALIDRTLHPVQFALTSRWLAIASALDYLALLGIWAALALCVWLLWKRKFDLAAIAALIFGAFAGTLGAPQIWSDAYAFGRTLSPLLIWLALRAIIDRQWSMLIPISFAVPRILFQFQPQCKGILHQMFG